MDLITLALIVAMAGAIIIRLLPLGYDPACNECQARVRREKEAKREKQERANHDGLHFWHGPDWACDNAACARNPKTPKKPLL